MSEYRKHIEYLAENKLNEIFYNSNEEHALIVLKNIVKHSDKYIKTICGNMCSEVSNNADYLDTVRNYLSHDKNAKFQILFDDFDDDFPNRKIAKLLSDYPNQVEIRKSLFGSLYYEKKPVHITIADDRSFRIETDTIKKMAWCNFNDEKKAKSLSLVFDKFFADEYSQVVKLP